VRGAAPVDVGGIELGHGRLRVRDVRILSQVSSTTA
jgi:hypothetical protein